MIITSHGMSDIGLDRENNEDRFAIDNDLQLYIVCDGMGGHAGGEVAAATAINSVMDYFRSFGSNETVDEPLFAARANFAIKRASREIHQLAASDWTLNKMGTTLTMLLLSGDQAHIANVGDSRAYLISDGRARLLTTDQTVRNELLKRGYSPDDALANGRFARMLTHNVGEGDSVRVDTVTIDIEPGDRFLLCTDGLSKYVTSGNELTEIIDYSRPQAATDALVNLAKHRGGSDNITAIIVSVDRVFSDDSTVEWRVAPSIAGVKQTWIEKAEVA